MKFLSLIAILVSFSAFAEATISRTFDGHDPRCEIKGDTGRRFYKLEIESEKLTETKRELVLNVLFYKCSLGDNGKVSIEESSSDEVLHGHVMLPNGELGLTNNTLTQARFAIVDKNERLMGQAPLDLNQDAKTISFSYDKNVERVFVIGAFKSTVELPTGEVLKDIFEYVGGFVIKIN